MRPDLEIVAKQIDQGSRVLDLGCGRGELLAWLQRFRSVNGYGLDIDPDNINACISAGVNVLEQDLNLGLANFPDDSFDTVVMTETIQAVADPVFQLREMLRIARNCVVSFPNFANWRCRLYLATRGTMPIASHLPNRWYDTPNIHLCSFKDFEELCQELDINIVERFVVDAKHQPRPLMNRFPNFFGVTAFYRLARSATQTVSSLDADKETRT